MALKSIGEASKKLLIETVTLPFLFRWIIDHCGAEEVKTKAVLRFSFQIPPASKSFQEAQNELNQTAADLNQSAGEVVHASRGPSSQLAVASGKFSQDFDEFLDAGIEMAGHTQVSGQWRYELSSDTQSVMTLCLCAFRKKMTRRRSSGA